MYDSYIISYNHIDFDIQSKTLDKGGVYVNLLSLLLILLDYSRRCCRVYCCPKFITPKQVQARQTADDIVSYANKEADNIKRKIT